MVCMSWPFCYDDIEEEMEREFITREKKQMLLSQQKEEVERVRAVSELNVSH